MKKPVIAIASIVVVAGLAVFLWQKGIFGGGAEEAAKDAEVASAGNTEAKKPAPRAEKKQAAPPGARAPEVFLDDDPKGPLRLEGQVLDDTDDPVAGAVVILNSNPPRKATSEEDGSFAFNELVPRGYTLRAHKDDLVGGPIKQELTESSDPVTIRLALGGSVAVTVVDKEGNALAGAGVELRDADDVRTASTDGDGKASFRGVARGFTELVASASGYGVGRRLVQVPRKPGVIVEIRMVLREGAPVAGRVVDAAGVGVAGARVIANDASATFSASDLRRDGVVTDKSGNFKLSALSAGSYRFAAVHREHAPGSSDLISLDGVSEKRDITIELAAGGTIAGTVSSVDGEPVPFATVRVMVANGSFNMFGGSSIRQATCDEDGGFEISGLARAKLRVLAQSDSASSEAMEVDLRQTASRKGLAISLGVTGMIAGVVVDSEGEPVAEAQVIAYPDFWKGGPTGDMGLRSTAAATSDGGGSFALRGLPEGQYRLNTSRDDNAFGGLMQSGVEASTGTKDVRLVIESPGAVAGKLALEDGSTPELFTVTVGFPPGVPAGTQDGAFEVDRIPPGTYDVTFRGPLFAARTIPDVEVKAGETTDMGTVRASRGRAVSGRVMDKAGNPVAGAAVIAARQLFGDGKSVQADLGAGMEEFFGAKRTVSMEDGSYRIAGIGKAELQIVAEHTETGRSLPGKVPAGTGDLTQELVLQPFGTVFGRVLAAEAPAAGVSVMASAKSGGTQMVMVQTGEDGGFIFEHLPEGPHRITATLTSQNFSSANSAGVEVEVVGGQRVEAEITVEVGDISLEVVIAGKDNATIDAAQVFLFKGEASPKNGKEVSEVFLQMNQSGGAMMGMALGGKPASLSGVSPGDYSLCILPINGDLNDTDFAMRLQQNVEHLEVHCQPKSIAATPVKQTLTEEVPPMKPLPAPQL